ncbi:Ulp1 family isopeptidase [Rickettsia sp. Tenjiku01]|uniref:Ulp1 family isopeptidase n=1 Tax=Rickettsia sp. Tenjiku01 TaxID=1736693 RepID=UPI0007DB2F8B|nr:Ulp1 family isopeptidase [Rickettsia sp. Tenjiku01]
MADPIIFTLLLGDEDRILEKINKQETQNKLPIIRLEVNKASHIPDKERIFSEILQESHKKSKTPIFNIQLNNNNIQPIFKVQDLINLQNLNIKTTITFDQYNSLPQNSELEAYWKQIMKKVDHVFFTNEADQNLSIADGIVPKDKATTITDISLVTSVFNNLVSDRKIDQLLSGTIPDKEKLDKIIKNTKNQGGRVIIETWPLSADEATNLITAKFGITSEDQIYGLKLEINEILKDANNAAENLKKYVSQISRQFQKDLGKTEVNPIDFNFINTKKVMNDRPKDIQIEQTISYEPPKANQPQPQVFFKRIFNYFKDIITSFKEAIFGKKEEPKTHESTTPTTEAKPTITEEPLTTVASSINPPQQQAPANNQKPWEKLGIPQEMYKESLKAEQQLATPVIEPKQQIPEKKSSLVINTEDQVGVYNTGNIKQPTYLYTEDDIKNILEANIDKNMFSIFHHASLEEPEILKDTLRVTVEDLILDNKPAIIPLNTGYKHWLLLMANKDDKGNINFMYNDPYGEPLESRPKVTEYITEIYSDAKITDLNTKQQENVYDCGVFVCDSAIKLSKGQKILTTEESKDQGINLRKAQANTLLIQQQAIAIGHESRKTSSTNNKFHNLSNSRKTKDTERSR